MNTPEKPRHRRYGLTPRTRGNWIESVPHPDNPQHAIIIHHRAHTAYDPHTNRWGPDLYWHWVNTLPTTQQIHAANA